LISLSSPVITEADVHHESGIGPVETHVQDFFSLNLILLEALNAKFRPHSVIDTG
jgi:hypothetical protein